jgi:hypothetical protein
MPALPCSLVERFCEPEAPLTVAVDGSVFARSGREVHGAVRHHDAGAQPDGRGFKFGNCFVVAGLVVRIGALDERAWCLALLFRLWLPTPKPSNVSPNRCVRGVGGSSGNRSSITRNGTECDGASSFMRAGRE